MGESCNAPSYRSRYLTTPLVKLSFRAFCVKSWNFEGLLGKYLKSDSKGMNPLSLSFLCLHLERKGRKLERKGEERLEVVCVCAQILEDHHHLTSVWVINYS